MGRLVTRSHCDEASGYIDAGVAAGAELLVDGRGLSLQGYEGGYPVGQPPHAQAGGRPLLHPAEDHHDTLAHRHPRRGRLRHADHGVARMVTDRRFAPPVTPGPSGPVRTKGC